MNHFFLIFLIKIIINNILKKTKITFTNPLVKVSSLDFKLNIKVLYIKSKIAQPFQSNITAVI